MIVRTGTTAKKLYRAASRDRTPLGGDPAVYDYCIKNGAVLIRRKTKECLYIKTDGGSRGLAIALQGMPKEFAEHRTYLRYEYKEAHLIDWTEIEEMTSWAPNVPQL